MRIDKALVLDVTTRDAKDRDGNPVTYMNVQLGDQDEGGVLMTSWQGRQRDLPHVGAIGSATIKVRNNRGGMFLDLMTFGPAVATGDNGYGDRDTAVQVVAGAEAA